METTKCDLCRKVKPKGSFLDIKGWVTGSVRTDEKNKFFDLCPKCGPELANLVFDYFEKREK